MNARPAACTAPSAVPATTATAKNCALVCTRYAAATTTHHCTSVTMTTNFGPRTSVGRAHAQAPTTAASWTTK